MNQLKIKAFVDALREKFDLNAFPVSLEEFAKIAGVQIKYKDFDEDLSGFAYQKYGIKMIGVNSTDRPERQRFTIAHELGHLFLHKQNTVTYDQEFMMFRDSHSKEGTDLKEIQANAFAAELLMPEEVLREKLIAMGGINIEDEKALESLAKDFKVSKTAITVRLSSLYFS